MKFTDDMLKNLEIIFEKEQMFGQIIVWLKAKGHYKECMRDLGIKVSEEEKEL
ncbi:MAG: hypothetical protein ABIG95_02620 [Candidatus Woesearchaeota archaeon]